MKQQLLYLHGPFSIQSYGLMIALGLLIFQWLIQRNKRFTDLNLKNSFDDILIMGIFSALFGGRTLFMLNENYESFSLTEFFSLWLGGFSILGAIMGVLICIPPFLYIKKIPLLPLLDLVAIYTPLLQAFGRLGCLFAGCCYGAQTELPWAIIYTDPNTVAPLCTAIHPTQLYSAILLLISFLILYLYIQHKKLKPGTLLSIYLILVSCERFIVDFWRDDRIFITYKALPSFITQSFSTYQLIAVGIFLLAGMLSIYLSHSKSGD